MSVEFGILGPVRVVCAGEVVALGGRQQRMLLAALLMRAPDAVSRDRLIDELWGERPPVSAAHAVEVNVSRLRTAFRGAGADGVLGTSVSGYALSVDPELIDARRFERLVGESQGLLAFDPAGARSGFESALGLWRGEPLGELEESQYARVEADRLEELRAVAVEGLVEARLACGEDREMIGQLTGLVIANPLRERPRRLLMLALYRAGRHAEALEAYRDACTAFDELGLQPGPELRQLQQAILNHDPSIAAPAALAGGGADQDRGGNVRGLAASAEAISRELPVSGTVTMLFTDIAGSTGLAERLGDRYSELLALHYQLLREALEATGGYEVGTAGDSMFAVFTHAGAALDCALRAQRALQAASWPEGESVRVRMGVHTGAPVVQDGTYVGIDVHCAARVMAVAHGGQVLLTKASRDTLPSSFDGLLDLGHHRLKDLPAPVHLFQAVAVDLPSGFPALRSLSNSNLPAALHGLIGRSSEVSTVLRLLERGDLRLLTLLGPGGAGKTRLALEIAGEAVTRYRDGAWFVSLAALADPSLIASDIAQTLGVRESEGRGLDLTLADFLARRELLLVLDNFEHLLGGADLVSRLLEAAPALDVLVTSREALNVRGEHRVQVAPLAPADAAELFIERARAVRADAIEEPDDHTAVDRICERLDGLPLALELAAARVALFSVPALDTRLAQRLDLPQGARDLPDRQRTLRATIDWSYQLLSPAEQALFREMACFAGGARLDAIESLNTDPDSEPVQTIAGLIDKSLLRRRDDPDGQPRFWMLETICQYAHERLVEDGRADATATRHARYYLEFAEHADQLITTSQQRAALASMEADHDNLRAAFEHLIVSDPAGAVRMAAALGFFWVIRGYQPEAREKLARVLATPYSDRAAAAKATLFMGWLMYFSGDYAEAQPVLEQALHLAREASLHRVQVMAVSILAFVEVVTGRHDRSIELGEQAITVAHAQSDDWALSLARNSLGTVLCVVGQTDRGRAILEEALALARRVGDPMAIIHAAINLADPVLAEGSLDAAESLIAEAVHHARDISYPMTLSAALALDALLALNRADLEHASNRINESLELVRTAYHPESAVMLLAASATLAAARDDPLRAAQLWAAFDSEMAQAGVDDAYGARRLRDRWLPQARRSADATAWRNAWTTGTKLTPRQALDLIDLQSAIGK